MKENRCYMGICDYFLKGENVNIVELFYSVFCSYVNKNLCKQLDNDYLEMRGIIECL